MRGLWCARHLKKKHGRILYWKILLILTAGVISFLVIPFENSNKVSPARAQGPEGADQQMQGLVISEPVNAHVFNKDLRTLPTVAPWKPGDPVYENSRRVATGLRPEGILPLPSTRPFRDPLLALQESVSSDITALEFSTPDLNIDGLPFGGGAPPDTVGEVGPNHYIQMVNASVVNIYDKSGSLLAGPFALDSLWTAGGDCATGAGDPIVLYDRFADRWLMSEFVSPFVGNRLCLYISQTSDPVTGGWFLYDFPTPDFPDYPKYAVWPDAYYVSSNESSPAVYALDRNQMLSGSPATSQRFTAPSLAGFGFQALIPSDLDGALPPPVGSPNYFMRHRDDEVHNVGANDPNQDSLEIWEFGVDFDTPANSTFTQTQTIAVTDFDSNLCGLSSFFCFPQPNTSVTLDPLREVIMWRLQYRNFGAHETLVGNFVTDVDGTDHGGIRWFELRKSGGDPWTLFQEGTYAPDAAHRWMGSIAMDRAGNIALGYSVSSNIISPSIRYTGRRVTDPVGTMPRGENVIIDGPGVQTSATRWGDYSSMSVDPADDCTFWYTNEYVLPSGNWQTRIASFRFDSCGKIYLPLIFKNATFAPDLIIEEVMANSNAVTVTIKNRGNAPVNDAFWVEVYFNPGAVPELNQPWDEIADAGVVWGIELGAGPPLNLPIESGETRTLTLANAFFGDRGSSLPPYPVGVDVYALVDSVDFSTAHGALLESNEDNNLFGPIISVASDGEASGVIGDSELSPSSDLPPREQE